MPTKRCDDSACDMRQGTFTYESTDHLYPNYCGSEFEVEQMLAEGWTLTYHNHGRNDMPTYDMPTYKIVRFRFQGDNEVIRTGVTLEEAQDHCNDESTHGDGWFDGYQEE